MYDLLLYVLMFPHGDKGWEVKSKAGECEYYAYRLMQQAGSSFNIAPQDGLPVPAVHCRYVLKK